MAETMIERVARAIRTYGVKMSGAPWVYAVIGEDFDKPIVDGLTAEEAYAKAAQMNARAAFEAMREPTDDVIEAGRANNFGRYPNAAWEAMIDTILSESPSSRDGR